MGKTLIKKPERNSSLELLRVISMILIVMHHFTVHGAFDLANQAVTANKIFLQIFSFGGRIGVNLFIFITGYFMIKSSFKLQKLVKIILEIFFYSVVCYTLLALFGFADFNLKSMAIALFSVIFEKYWFAAAYIILYLLSPFINIFLKNITQKVHFYLICLFIFIWVIIPTFTAGKFGMSDVLWFIALYVLAAYIRLYPNKVFNNIKVNLTVSLILIFCVWLSIIVFDLIGTKISVFAEHAAFFIGMNRLPSFIASVALFLVFKNLNIGTKKWINQIAMSTFGVYLIHDNTFMRTFLWEDLFKNNQYLESGYLVPYAVAVVLIVYVACTLIDQMRIYFLERPLFWFYNSKCIGLQRIFSSFKQKAETLADKFIRLE